MYYVLHFGEIIFINVIIKLFDRKVTLSLIIYNSYSTYQLQFKKYKCDMYKEKCDKIDSHRMYIVQAKVDNTILELKQITYTWFYSVLLVALRLKILNYFQIINKL